MKLTTQDKILEAALKLFAKYGFEAVTLKDITEEAGVNVAAIHYHIGDKQKLIQTVLASATEPVNQLRLSLLKQLEDSNDLTLKGVVEALVSPPIQQSISMTGNSRLLIRLLMHARALPEQKSSALIFSYYDDLALRFVEAFMKVTPGLGREEAFWRYSFTIGAMMYVITDSDKNYHRINQLSDGLCDTDDPATIINQLVVFIVAGFQAKNITV